MYFQLLSTRCHYAYLSIFVLTISLFPTFDVFCAIKFATSTASSDDSVFRISNKSKKKWIPTPSFFYGKPTETYQTLHCLYRNSTTQKCGTSRSLRFRGTNWATSCIGEFVYCCCRPSLYWSIIVLSILYNFISTAIAILQRYSYTSTMRWLSLCSGFHLWRPGNSARPRQPMSRLVTSYLMWY